MIPPNNQSQEVLRECPCCNSTVTIGGGGLSQELYSIRCSYCGITLRHSDKLVLIERWNTRFEPKQQQSQVPSKGECYKYKKLVKRLYVQVGEHFYCCYQCVFPGVLTWCECEDLRKNNE